MLNAVTFYWCSTHNREATHEDANGRKCCDPKLAGIMMPCIVENMTSISLDDRSWEKILEAAEFYRDEGIEPEGWQSKELEKARKELERQLLEKSKWEYANFLL